MSPQRWQQWIGVVGVVMGVIWGPQLVWAQALLEAPEPASVQSGVSLIRGWVCDATVVELALDGGARFAAVYGLSRSDTQPTCGDEDNGFAFLVNWNDTGEGPHELQVFADGVMVAQATFTVTTLGLGSFPTGLSGRFAIADFPRVGQAVEIEWREAAQNFVLTGGARGGGGGPTTTRATLEAPEPASVQSGVSLIRGWVCDATVVELALDGGARFAAVYGLSRSDTQPTCGDEDNGFAFLVNWNDVGAGLHRLQVFADGVVVATAEFPVVTLGLGSFPTGLDRTEVLADFPEDGDRVQVRWQESRQNFGVEGVLPPGRSAGICSAQRGQLPDRNGMRGEFRISNPCALAGGTLEFDAGFPMPVAVQGGEQLWTQNSGETLSVCEEDLVIIQGGQQFTPPAFHWVDGQGDAICRALLPGEVVEGLILVGPGVGLDFGQEFEIRVLQNRLATFSAAGAPMLQVNALGDGQGTVTSSPGGITCGLDCTESYSQGTVVTLTAAPSAGSSFAGWSGDCSGTTPSVQVLMTTDRSCTAMFNPGPIPLRTLTVTKQGSGSGTVTSGPAGIDCGTDCTELYNDGTVVTLTATPDEGSTFEGWSGDCSGTEPTTSVTMTADLSCVATFEGLPPPRTLTITKAGSGSGVVTSDPAGIDCGSICTASYPDGEVVTLTAAPDELSMFAGWSGDPDCSDGQVTLTANLSCTATFTTVDVPPRTLTVTKQGSGSGTVTSSPAGIDCGSVCTASYADGEVVTLTATADEGSTFEGWSGDPDCSDGQVTLTVDRSCMATFNAEIIQRTLTISKAGSGSGTVTSSPAGIDCGSVCTASYADGEVVTLTATPEPGSNFTGWSGDPDCRDGQVTLTTDLNCTANFDLPPSTAPTISNISAQLTSLNNCPLPGGPNGSSFTISFNYSDPNGDANGATGATVGVDFQFIGGSTGSFDCPTQFVGDGFSGTANCFACFRFATTTGVNLTITLTDGAELQSNPLMVSILKPPDANIIAPSTGESAVEQGGPLQ